MVWFSSSVIYFIQPPELLSVFQELYLNLSLCVLAICIVLTTSQLYSHQMHFETCKYSKMRLRDPAGGAHSAPPDPLAGFKGAYF